MSLATLPKAHLHLHFTGSMRHATLLELAERDGIRLPDALRRATGRRGCAATDEKGWFRFQRLYDVARSVLRTEDDVRRLVREAAEDDVRDGLRLAGDPGRPDGVRAPARRADHRLHGARPRRRPPRRRRRHGLGIAVVIAANRTRHPLDARTLARLAAQYAGPRRRRLRALQRRAARHGTGTSPGPSRSPSGPACSLAPHGGELAGPPASCGPAWTTLHADRIGHGVRAAEDPGAARPARRRAASTCEVCPVSNVALGVYAEA